MSNTLFIFLSFIVFLAFGYLSIIRLLVKREFGSFTKRLFLESIKNTRVLTSLGSSAFFVSMPATSLLLFWGWGPAILWLLSFHLLIETFFHLQYTTTEQELSLAELLIRSNGSKLAYIESGLVQGFFIILMAIMITLLATLIDEQSGLLFTLLALFPAQQLLRNNNSNVPWGLNAVGSFAILLIGIMFAHSLGFSVYGEWSPLNTLFGSSSTWLSINNVTLIAGVLIITSFSLAKKGQFQTDVATFSGVAITLLIVVMQIRLAWLRPVIDAPMNAAQTNDNGLPLLIGFCLFSFAGLSALLIRLLNDETNYSDSQTSSICFARLQIESVIQLVFSILLVLSLAAALGIGAWKTHYVEWSNSANFISHLSLSIKGTLQLVSSSFKIGTFAHTVIMACMCIAGISFSMMCVSRFKITRHSKENDNSLYAVLMNAKLPQAIIIFVLTCFFIAYGVSITTWLIVGMLSWALIVHLMQAITLEMPSDARSRLLYGAICLALMAVGSLQVLTLIVSWFSDQHFIAGCVALTILISVWVLWWQGARDIASRFVEAGNVKKLDIDE